MVVAQRRSLEWEKGNGRKAGEESEAAKQREIGAAFRSASSPVTAIIITTRCTETVI